MARLLLAGMNAEMLALARDLGHEVVAVVDPAAREHRWRDIPLFASDAEAAESGGFEAVAVAIDDPAARERVQQFYAEHGLEAAELIAGRVSPEARRGRGCVAQHGSHISVGCRLGHGVRLNVGANVMHDTVLGDYVTIAPNAVLLGHVVVGRLSYVGANATVLPRIRIGEGCVVGAGAVVTRPVADGAVVKGNPAV